jgi:probable HAF family extracellular repeat protein
MILPMPQCSLVNENQAWLAAGQAASETCFPIRLEQKKMACTHRTIGVKNRAVSLVWLPHLFAGLSLAGAAVAAPTQAGAAGDSMRAGAAPTTYRVINLGAGDVPDRDAFINAKDQVAYTLVVDPFEPVRSWFYDGASIRNVGTLGDSYVTVTGLNDLGQVVGQTEAAGGAIHSYLWSKAHGMFDIGVLPGATSMWTPVINNRVTIAGNAATIGGNFDHAFRWSPGSGLEDLGGLNPTNIISYARAINDAGMIAGESFSHDHYYHAYAWTRSGGMVDIHKSVGDASSSPVAVGARGQVAGNIQYGGNWHGFVWTRATGMRDIGTGWGMGSEVTAMSPGGQVTGFITSDDARVYRAMTWTHDGGLRDLGTLGGTWSWGAAANNKGQVVGAALTSGDEDVHAFVWTAREGLVDLNKRLRHAPAGLVVHGALAISDSGKIVAGSNAGLVLLTPEGRPCGCGHAAGPVAVPDLVQVGAPFNAAVSLAGEDANARHQVAWSWGDGSGAQAVTASERNGDGGASASHVYSAPGIYTVSANVVDQAGRSVTVTRKVVAYAPSSGIVGGTGAFASPHWAGKQTRLSAGRAAFSFLAPSAKAGTPGQLIFNQGGMAFHSKDLRPVALGAGRARFEGNGTVNGKGSYKVALTTTAGASAREGVAGRVGLKIWHIDPATRAEVVDYDNEGGAGAAGGSALVEGRIVVQQ